MLVIPRQSGAVSARKVFHFYEHIYDHDPGINPLDHEVWFRNQYVEESPRSVLLEQIFTTASNDANLGGACRRAMTIPSVRRFTNNETMLVCRLKTPTQSAVGLEGSYP